MEDTRHITYSSKISSSTHAWEFSEKFLIVLHRNLQDFIEMFGTIHKEEEISSVSVPLYTKTFYTIKSCFITKL